MQCPLQPHRRIMSAPYSDNLYSADLSSDDEQDERDALSPSDGYFHASSSSNLPQAPQQHTRGNATSSNVPAVPNVLVEDPTLREQGVDKAREAEQERLNEEAAQPSAPVPQSRDSYPPFSPTHHHRRSVDEDDGLFEAVGHTSPSGTRQAEAESRPFPHQQQHHTHQQIPHQISDAPPAYSPPLSPTSGTAGGYHTFGPTNSTMGLPYEQQHLIPREPESMGGPPEGSKPALWQRIKETISNRLTIQNLRGKVKTALGTLVILSIFLMVLSGFSIRPYHTDPDLGDKIPVREPTNDEFHWLPDSQCLDNPTIFSKVVTPIQAQHTKSLNITQKIIRTDQRNGWSPHIGGHVVLQPTLSAASASITLEVISNHKDLGASLDFSDGDEQTYTVSTPDRVAWSYDQGPCIQIRVTVHIPREAWLQSLHVGVVQLGIAIKDGLTLGVMDESSLTSISGDIKTATLKRNQDEDVVPYLLGSREIIVKTVSGNINGWFPLYDLLRLTTTSGDVTADIQPKTVNPERPEPAVLDVHTVSGTVKLFEPIDRALGSSKPDKVFPPRDYDVTVFTASGDVTAELAVSSETQFNTQSGNLQLKLWPILDPALLTMEDSAPKLETYTKSGDTTLDLLEPAWTGTTRVRSPTSGSRSDTDKAWPPAWDEDRDFSPIEGTDSIPLVHFDDESDKQHRRSEREKHKRSKVAEVTAVAAPPLGSLNSKHSSISGKMDLTYPSTWEGYLSAYTISGSQNIHGEGLEVSATGTNKFSHVRGRKGKGLSNLKVDTVSGDQKILIGKKGNL
ncbi:hypothetical protein HJFPF1_07948 [Paramyrothecium foliicola]|nr:hypothetical protein HJFPF1_07948 [Paramyrothecium foliicola]